MKLAADFFYDEVRDGFYIPGMMKRAWGAGMRILFEIDRICKKYDIRYFISAGTLLGAVREGSFIPWDDDLDVIMLRDEFTKFSQVVAGELIPELTFSFGQMERKIKVIWLLFRFRRWSSAPKPCGHFMSSPILQ